MTIGIKYCGGCNPRYDRTDIPRRLASDFPAHTIQIGAGAEPDVAVVVCGCPSQCASHRDFTGRRAKAVLYAPEHYESLCDLITQCEQE